MKEFNEGQHPEELPTDNHHKENKPESSKKKASFSEDFKDRLSVISTGRWIRFTVVSIILLLFVFWINNWWLLLIWFLLFDIYITCYVPWGWWKNLKGPGRKVMGWVDAIVYALVLVYIIFAFIGQNYTIPSSSLEKSLLVGDFLWVNKAIYGPRVPNTPVHFPLAHHTMPVIGGKSYLDNPSLSYHRLPGIRQVERGDIVVFNFPEGDTVLSKMPDADYYMIVDELAREGNQNPREFIKNNPQIFGEIIVRPVDRRENYVKRTIGLPGDRFQIKDDIVYINGEAISNADNVQFNYIVKVNAPVPESQWKDLGVRSEDYRNGPISHPDGTLIYSVPLTAEMKKTVETTWPQVKGPLVKENESGIFNLGNVWPLGSNWNWTRSNTDEFWIPSRGTTLRLTLNNLPLYRRAITTYEGNDLKVIGDKIYINGKPADYYTFKYDYYWMMGDNRDRSLDSRYFGLVPEDHIIGQPMLILASFDNERNLTEKGFFRIERFFRNPNPDKDKAVEKNWASDSK